MVLFVPTPTLTNLLNSTVHDKHIPPWPTELNEKLAPLLHEDATVPSQDQTIDHKTLKELSLWARELRNKPGTTAVSIQKLNQFSLASLLSNAILYTPPLPPRVRSEELIKTLQAIQRQQDIERYNEMTSLAIHPPYRSLLPLKDYTVPVESSIRPIQGLGLTLAGSSEYGYKTVPKSVADEWKEVRREVGVVFNVLVSMFGVGTAVWWVSPGVADGSYGTRLLLSMFGALSIAAIEAFLYYQFFRKMQSVPKKKVPTSSSTLSSTSSSKVVTHEKKNQ